MLNKEYLGYSTKIVLSEKYLNDWIFIWHLKVYN